MSVWPALLTQALLGGTLAAAQTAQTAQTAPVADQPWPVTSTTALSSGAYTAPLDASWTPGRPGFLYWQSPGQSVTSFSAAAVTAAGVVRGSPMVLRAPSGGAAWSPSRESDAGGRALLVSYSANKTAPIQTAELTPAGTMTRRQKLTARNRHIYACSDMASDGSAVIAWPQKTAGRWKLRLSNRSASGRRFSAPRTIDTKPVSGLSCSAAPAGRWIVAAIGRTSERYGSPADRLTAYIAKGRATPRPRDLGPVLNVSVPTTAIDGRGRGFILWRGQAPDTEQARPWVIRGASLAASGRATAVQKLAEGFGDSGGLDLAGSPVGGASATIGVTTRTDQRNQELMVLTAGNDGRFRRVPSAIPPPAAGALLRYDAGGQAAITWQAGSPLRSHAGLLVDGQLNPLGEPGEAYAQTITSFTPEGRILQVGIRADGDKRQLETRTQP